jgi:serine/threonine protein kinase
MSSLDDTGNTVVAGGMVLGMKSIHSQGLVQGDLGPENLIIDEGGCP